MTAMTLTPITIDDANSANKTMSAYNDGTNNAFSHVLLDQTTGLPVSPANSGNQATANTSLATIATNTTGAATAANQSTGNTSLATIATNTAGAATAANQATGNTSLATIATAVQAAIPIGSNIIGKMGIDQTTPGTTNGVQVNAALPAGSNTIGNVVNAAGSNIIGKIGIDQTTPGTTNGVQVNAALPAGTNTIGAVSAGVNVIAGNTTTRPANTTTYSFSTLVANSTTAGSVVAPTIAAAKGINIPTAAIRCRLQANGTSTTNAIFRVHFWNAAPTVTNGDGGAFVANFDSTYCGSFDVTCGLAGSASIFGIGVPTNGQAMVFSPASGTSNLYYLIEARAAYTPTSGEVFTPYLEIQ